MNHNNGITETQCLHYAPTKSQNAALSEACYHLFSHIETTFLATVKQYTKYMDSCALKQNHTNLIYLLERLLHLKTELYRHNLHLRHHLLFAAILFNEKKRREKNS